MAALLRAAGQVFADVGYENATTNAIAARAGVSPGTLYQFFPNKQAMAEALAEAYAEQNQALHEGVFDLSAAEAPLRDLIDRLVDPFLEFRRNAPGFDTLFVGSVVSRELAERVQALHQQMQQPIPSTRPPSRKSSPTSAAARARSRRRNASSSAAAPPTAATSSTGRR
jgi:AcrR family transcriptional regulator